MPALLRVIEKFGLEQSEGMVIPCGRREGTSC